MKKKERLGFHIVLLGQTASGKETQARILAKKYALKFVETGVYTRKLLKEKNPEGDIARRTAGRGKPLHSLLFRKFLVKEISNNPKNKDLLFLGGPRLKPEIQLLKKILDNNKQDFMSIYVTLPEKEVYKRSLHRAQDKNIKDIYKVFDTKEIIAKRLKYYREQVSKTVKYLEKIGKLTKVNGNQSISKVTKDILKAIEKHKNRQKT